MAIRPVFTISDIPPHYVEHMTEFTYYPGFANSQRRKSSESLRDSFSAKHPNARLLEVSRFSDNILGQKLSAFNLMTALDNGDSIPIENAFQSSKKFTCGGPYSDLLYVSPAEAKKDERLKSSGPLVSFVFQGIEFPLIPKTFFYDWIYISALSNNTGICDELLKYNAFTDIAFNPEKSINCQARTVAIFVSLCKCAELREALESPLAFKQIVYGRFDNTTNKQISLF